MYTKFKKRRRTILELKALGYPIKYMKINVKYIILKTSRSLTVQEKEELKNLLFETIIEEIAVTEKERLKFDKQIQEFEKK